MALRKLAQADGCGGPEMGHMEASSWWPHEKSDLGWVQCVAKRMWSKGWDAWGWVGLGYCDKWEEVTFRDWNGWRLVGEPRRLGVVSGPVGGVDGSQQPGACVGGRRGKGKGARGSVRRKL